MLSWFMSLQFRLVLGFALVLALALASVSLYVGYAARQEVKRFDEEVQQVRAARVEELVSQHYAARRGWAEIQPVLEQVSSLYGRRIIVTNSAGQVIADSHLRFQRTMGRVQPGSQLVPVVSGDTNVGSLVFSPDEPPEVVPEPAVTRIVNTLNRSLIWTGLAAGAGGILLVSLVSSRMLSPLQALRSAARRLGHGHLSERVSASGPAEVEQLALAFNSMAGNLESAERQRRHMVADVAHEIRTPLSNIQGYLEAVKDGLLRPDETTIETIYQQVLHLTNLVEDLRLLALTEAGRLRLSYEPTGIDDLLDRCVEAVRPRCQAKGIALSLQVSAHIPLVSLDRTRISQVVGNLLQNAITHTPSGGNVAVTAQRTGGSVDVTVADTGEGIPADQLPLIFERFHRVDPSRTRETGGAGLGLTIARQLVQAHGGTIEAESVLGSGTRIVFRLPLSHDDDFVPA